MEPRCDTCHKPVVNAIVRTVKGHTMVFCSQECANAFDADRLKPAK